jgi:signal transduction histidine kinase
MGTPIRWKILGLLLVPLISMITLWGVITVVTAGESLQLRTYTTLWTTLRVPADQLIVELQAERLVSARLLSDARGADRAALRAQRLRTDRAREDFRSLALSKESQDATTRPMRKQVTGLITYLSRIDDIRAEIDSGLSPRIRVIETYNAISDEIFRLHRSLALIDDIPIYQQTRVVINLAYAKELLTREEALAATGAGPARLTADERRLFTQVVGNRRFLIDQALPELYSDVRAIYTNLISAPRYQRLRILEELIVSGHAPAASTWQDTASAVADYFQNAQAEANSRLAERAEPIADDVLIRAFVIAGLGLLLVVVSIFVSLRMGRRLSTELATLRQVALDLAQVRLPSLVQRLREGEDVDVETEAPQVALRGRTAEIQDVGHAFSTVQHTAVEAAVGQAQLRAGVGMVFRNLARRSQILLHRQRIQLDGMQRRATEPGQLDDLFRLDHLTTRMRRHAENLIILSGSTPGRGWRRPVPMIDVMRGAAAEVEDYARVTVVPSGTHSLAGEIVSDVIHLVAELIENATVYSPPHTTVYVRGQSVARGFAIDIEDRGHGMDEDRLDALNEQLANPPEFDLADSERLGLFVVARLAARHGIRVTLRVSPYGGTTAIVLIPAEQVVEQVPGQTDEHAADQVPGQAETKPAGPAARPPTQPEIPKARPPVIPIRPHERDEKPEMEQNLSGQHGGSAE